MRNDMEKVSQLLISAKKERKGDYSVYNAYKNQLDNLLLDSKVYELAIQNLCKILKV